MNQLLLTQSSTKLDLPADPQNQSKSYTNYRTNGHYLEKAPREGEVKQDIRLPPGYFAPSKLLKDAF